MKTDGQIRYQIGKINKKLRSGKLNLESQNDATIARDVLRWVIGVMDVTPERWIEIAESFNKTGA